MSRRAGGIEAARDGGAWECRYFPTTLPPRLGSERLEAALGPAVGPVLDTDVYLLHDDLRSNVKVRRRTSTLKVKLLVDRTPDDFELWRTELESALPAPAAAARLVAELAGPTAPDALAGADVDELVELLCGGGEGVRCITVTKHRRFYFREAARLELAEVVVAGRRLYSVAVESPDLAQSRALHAELAGADLGPPDNYLTASERFSLR
jgi:hypothetical protein